MLETPSLALWLRGVCYPRFTLNGLIHLPFNLVRSSFSQSRKNGPKINSFHLCVGLWCWACSGDIQCFSSFKPGRLSWCQRAHQVLFDHSTFSQSFSKSFKWANIKAAFTCAFLNKDTLQHSVRQIVFLPTVVLPPVSSQSSRVVVGSSLTFHIIIFIHWDKILQTKCDWRFFPPHLIFDNHSNICQLLTRFLVDGFVTHSSLVLIYYLVSDILWQLCGFVYRLVKTDFD